jgi:RNA polymerase sigma-70 factor (ECF subfamily)
MSVKLDENQPMTSANTQHAAFLQAYDAYSDAIFRHCYFRVYDREKAREMMQDVFMKTWEYIVQGKKIDNIRAFLYRVANNMAIDWSRKKKESSLEDLMEDGYEPQGQGVKDVTLATEVGEMMGLLDKLDEKYREPVRMRYLEELSPKEIAQVLGESENVISVRIHRGLAQLRAMNAQHAA